MIVTTPKEQAIIISTAILEHRIKNTYESPFMGLPLTVSVPSYRQLEQLRHFAKQGVKVRLK